MIKKTIALAALAAFALPSQALTAGDLAFTSFNADDDGWAVVTFVDISAGTTLYFNDNEWNGTAFNTGEHGLVWNTGAAVIAAGTVVTFLEIDQPSGTPDTLSASVGSLALAAGAGTNLGLSKSDETFYLYEGTSATAATSFLAAVTTENDSAPSNLSNAGLTVGSTALALVNDADFGEYTGVRSGLGTYGAYRGLVNNAAQWNDVASGEFTGNTLNATAFTVTAVPEPESYALMLAGLGLVGAVARRTRRG